MIFKRAADIVLHLQILHVVGEGTPQLCLLENATDDIDLTIDGGIGDAFGLTAPDVSQNSCHGDLGEARLSKHLGHSAQPLSLSADR
ncbi:MAG TPA: hypothetical protein VKH81_16110 [Candidatus Angelobacter sp.]|nr:hypothetical protein [Candidatus Angelobacter sp.]